MQTINSNIGYFAFKSSDTHNIVLNSTYKSIIEDYLIRTLYTLGKKLFIEIVFNDNINQEQIYFENYSEFNLKYIKNELDYIIDELNNIEKNSKKLKEIRFLLKDYNREEKLIERYFNLLDEHYNIILKPLNRSREKLKSIIFDSKAILDANNNNSYKQYGAKIIEKAKNDFIKASTELFELSNQNDKLYIEYKTKFIQIYDNAIKRINNDIRRIKNDQFSSQALQFIKK